MAPDAPPGVRRRMRSVRSLLLLAVAVLAPGAALSACGASSDDPVSTAPGGTPDAGADGDASDPDAGDAGSVPALDPSRCSDPGPAGPDFAAAYVPVPSPVLEGKALYLFSLLASDASSLAAIAADPTLSAIGKSRDAALRKDAVLCKGNPDCVSAALAPSADASAKEAAALVTALAGAGRLAWLAAEQMRPSGRFHRYAALPDAELVKTAYVDAAAALAAGFDAYARDLTPSALDGVVAAVVASHPEPLPFFRPLELVVLDAMAADGRDEAGRYEPLEAGENAAARAAIPTLDFAAHPFSLILVPGQGPTKPDVALDPAGQKRVDLAYRRFEKKQAPLFLLSGGHVHPDRTKYAEALEMKKYLMATYGVPASRILVDPHARHTTTNLRNGSRLALRYGVPADRPMLVTSDLFQSLYIGYWDGDFGPRCQKELGYLPWRKLVPLSDNDSCLVPVSTSLHLDARDLLDP